MQFCPSGIAGGQSELAIRHDALGEELVVKTTSSVFLLRPPKTFARVFARVDRCESKMPAAVAQGANREPTSNLRHRSVRPDCARSLGGFCQPAHSTAAPRDTGRPATIQV